ncbi:thermonuclease family protein [Bradyrhizobium sp. Tv2a-2]|uniref:thermonuclease family protein n=1 Tax=Bradyrhizobium sp. Tv2a-2 TaxID=113395 RepID=UPI001FD91F5E|nr:thermonuclease family protein [Bradyrhizobium sp. Tv2a-2]
MHPAAASEAVFPLSGMDETCKHAAMVLPFLFARVERVRARVLVLGLVALGSATTPCAASCAPPDLGGGHVAEIVDGRSFRLDDGREIRLAGIEPAGTTKADRVSALAAVLADHDVSLRGADDAPDRYGRQAAFVYLPASDTPVQAQLLSAGVALVSPDLDDTDCTAVLKAAEAEARQAQRGTWAGNAVIKNAESADDILAGMGRFMVVEGRVLSVHQSGATTYLNFGRSWTRDFAVTIPRRALPAFAQAGVALKSLENRRIRVRGWVEVRQGPGQGSNQGPSQGPRIDVVRVGQIELLGGN